MSEQLLKQIDSMARQIEESHAALRRRALVIKQQSEKIKELEQQLVDEESGADILETWNSGYAMGKTNGKRIAHNRIVTKLEAYKCTCLKNEECICSCVRNVLCNIIDDGGCRE